MTLPKIDSGSLLQHYTGDSLTLSEDGTGWQYTIESHELNRGGITSHLFATYDDAVRSLLPRLIGYFGKSGRRASVDLQHNPSQSPWELDLKMMMTKKSGKGKIGHAYHISLYPVGPEQE